MTDPRADRGKSVSTVLGRRLGGELLQMREACGLKQAHAAEALTASVAKVAKMERGLVPMRDPDVRALCHLYGETAEKTVGRLLGLAKVDRDRRRAKGWWDAYPELDGQAEYFALEDIAVAMRTWQQVVVPGLLQTPAYARALAVGTGAWDHSDRIDTFVEARMARQSRLAGERPLGLWAVLHEGALRQLVGNRGVMRAQLERILDAVKLPHIKVQVLPFTVGAHRGLTNSFTIMSFAEPGAVDVVRTDTVSANMWLENKTEAVLHQDVFASVARLGLSQQASVRLIDSIRREL